MAKKRTRKTEVPSPVHSEGRSYGPLISVLTKTVTIGLIVAAPLVPEGAAESVQNWPMILLWLLACVGIFAGHLLDSEKRWQWNLVDVCFYGVCLWATVSGIASLVFETGHARQSINATWQWIGFGVSFLVLRSLMENAAFRRIAILALCGIAIGCSCAGLYQNYVTFPAIRAEYQELDEEGKQNALRRGGISNVEAGAVERTLWETRLFSTETTSTFVLANSLAAFLTPSFVLALGFLIRSVQARSRSAIAISIAALALIAICLIFTKSRTGLLAVVIGAGCLLLCKWRNSSGKFPWRWAIGCFVSLGVLAAFVWAAGVIKTETIRNASKSLAYRMEYWQASAEMIKEHLLFGCGPGNFQQYYSDYQLPQSSETVSDPHNFLIEIWANAGTPTAILLISGCLLWILNQCKCCIGKPELTEIHPFENRDEKHAANEANSVVKRSRKQNQLSDKTTAAILFCGVLLGLGIGCFQVLTSGMEFDLVFVAGAVCLTFLGIFFFIERIKLDAPIFSPDPASESVALFAFFIGLSAAGGISLPSVAISGVIVLAATQSQAKSYERSIPRWLSILAIVICIVGFFLFRYSVVDPIQKARQYQRSAEQAIRSSNPELALAEMEQAIASDPSDGNYLFFKAQILLGRFERQPTSENLDLLIGTTEKSIKARPHNSKVALESGKLFLSLSKRVAALDQKKTANVQMLKKVNSTMIESFHVAVDRRPNDAQHIAYLSYAYDISGEPKKAKQWANVALDLDEINPHPERDLNRAPFRFSDSASNATIEQELIRIRNE